MLIADAEVGKLMVAKAERGMLMAEAEAGKLMVAEANTKTNGKCVIVLLILLPISTQLIKYFPISLD